MAILILLNVTTIIAFALMMSDTITHDFILILTLLNVSVLAGLAGVKKLFF